MNSREARRDELAANLARLQARIGQACAHARRSASEITLIAVTKTFPADDVALLYELGIADVGENRDQEAAAKVAELTTTWGQPAQQRLRWHFIGGLQTNKCRSVAGYAHMVHSVDRPRLVEALAAAARCRAEPLRCLVQANLDETATPGRAGAPPADVPGLADAVAAAPDLQLAGVMGVAPLGGDTAAAFAVLAEIAARVRGAHPEATVISAGMTGDLEEAVAHGATHLRVGAAILGSRRHAG
jgi:pyridoxal phosphate enzyme (YggS family)